MASTNASHPKADLNSNGLVDFLDLFILGELWLESPNGTEPSPDFNFDDTVNAIDFSIFSNDWKESHSCSYKGNQPLDLEELWRQLSEGWGGDTYRISAEILSRLLSSDQYYGLSQVQS